MDYYKIGYILLLLSLFVGINVYYTKLGECKYEFIESTKMDDSYKIIFTSYFHINNTKLHQKNYTIKMLTNTTNVPDSYNCYYIPIIGTINRSLIDNLMNIGLYAFLFVGVIWGICNEDRKTIIILS